MPASLDDILLYQARILQPVDAAARAVDLARLQETWLRASLAALQTLDIRTGEKVVAKRAPDGDGVKLADGRRVRYLGLDAPEVANYGRPAQPLAREARDFNRLLLRRGPIVIIPDPDAPRTDAYGRLLRHVFVNGRWLNAALLLTGLAQPYRLDAVSPPIADLLKRASALAQQRHIGLWRHP